MTEILRLNYHHRVLIEKNKIHRKNTAILKTRRVKIKKEKRGEKKYTSGSTQRLK